ncbi:hypothetical protein [Sulfuricurvum sp.]|uniref:hypothetical protein n=1 Tax=Sulfuricurvum sp. TaxID=2025608 RepID=UPI00263252EF|nr:hypothetical protein [Sulfuricurvum sp.]MDD2838135.1 hypothetical protein [Sulfuricurvum sp.]MDD3596952.1 hypothetical protein [Sulfuricurvum sp.]MDD4883516.1 hypothetical protein [Sulfuricurvum sp.]
MWLIKFKKALILEEISQISSLLDEMPQFNTLQEIEEAAYLLIEGQKLLERNKRKTALAMQQLKNTIDFLKSTQNIQASSLNLKL